MTTRSSLVSRLAVVLWGVAIVLLFTKIGTGSIRKWFDRAKTPTGSTIEPGSPVTPVPLVAHTVTLKEVLISRQGEEQGMSRVDALRSDGATVTRFDYPQKRHVEAARTIVLGDGQRLRIDDVRGRWAKMEPLVVRRREPAAECLRTADGQPFTKGEVFVGRDTILQTPVVGTRIGKTTTWFAPDWSCAMLKLEVDFGPDSSVQTAVSLTAGEPTLDLFRLDGLVEVASAVFTKRSR